MLGYKCIITLLYTLEWKFKIRFKITVIRLLKYVIQIIERHHNAINTVKD